jgi:hypothetical protein
MKRKNFKRSLAIMVVFAILSACNFPSAQDATPATATEPPATEAVIAPTATNAPPTEIPILHTVIPVSLPENRSGHAGDYDSSVTAEQKKSNGGDRFTFEQFERPFNANTMDVYFPNLDIIDTFVYQDDTWIYGTIRVVDRSAANSSPYRLAMQLDVHVDGKGDYLVVAENPSSTDWTVTGVQVYFDTNSDVGDLTAMFTDLDAKNDGFETMLFDQGKGDDPDAAWVRASPDDPNTVQLAVKRSLVGNPPLYMVNMWTGHATLDPILFDYSDHYTHEQAGAADPGLPNFYPIKAVYELDNSCRMAVGFQPTGSEPGLCPVLQPARPEPGATVVGCNPTTLQLSACSQQNGSWNYSTCQCDFPPPVP